MAEMGNKVLMFCSEFQLQLNVFIVVACLVIGGKFMWSDEAREKAKKSLPYIILGAIIIAAAVNLGAEYGAKLQY